MKKFLKALAVLACAVALVAGSVAATLAYLTDTDKVVNTFTVGKVDITLDEAKVTLYGVKDGESRVQANAYKLIPGKTYLKDPTITVTPDSEACYLFFKLDNGLGDAVTFNIDTNKWKQMGETNVYYYTEVVTGGSYGAFSEFSVAQNAVIGDPTGKNITVTAYAVQADGFANATAAWDAANFA